MIEVVAQNVTPSPDGGPVTSTALDSRTADCVIVSVSSLSGVAAAVPTDNQGNVYTALAQKETGSARVRLYYCLNPITAASHTVSVSTNFPLLGVLFFRGVQSLESSQTNGTGTGTSEQTGPMVPAGDGRLFIAACSNLTAFNAINSGFTGLFRNTTGSINFGGGIAWLIQTGTAATLNPTITHNNGELCNASAIFSPKLRLMAGGSLLLGMATTI